MTTAQSGLQMTDRAAARIREIVTGSDGALRIAVNGGGCSGFQYEFSVVPAPEGEDLAIQHGGATVLVDPVSLPFLAGSTLDFVDDLMGQSFRLQNPQAKSSCGCGTSFSL
jgi:iron-sulfur cluster insertion protein